MKFCPHLPSALPSFLAAAFAFASWSSAVSAQPVLDVTVEERGQAAALEMTLDEVQIKRSSEQPNGLLKMTAEAYLPGASVYEDSGSSILVKLSKPLDRGDAVVRGDSVTAAFPEAEVAPVLYMKGAPHERAFRRIGTSEVQVIMTDGRSPEEIQALAGASSVRRTRVGNVIMLGFDNPYQAIDRSQSLQARGLRATPVMRRYFEKHATVPLDAFFSQQWHLLNVGQNSGTVGIDINVINAWDITLGGNTTIAVIDDGVETLHPDLQPNCPPVNSKLHHDFRDGDDDPKPIVAVGDGHGTCVAGLAGAAQNNGVADINTGLLTGVSGVAPAARLLGLRLIGGATTDEEAAEALYWHPFGANVGVSNNSYGYSETIGLVGADVLERAALRDAALLGRDGRGIVTVFSAGNGRYNEANANFATESGSRYVVTVGAMDAKQSSPTDPTLYSSYSTPGASLLVCAPGGEFGTFGNNQRMTTTDVTGTGGFNPTQGYSSDGGSDLPNIDYTNEMNGTSSAAPITAGTAALIISANPTLGWRDVKEILASTARRIDETNSSWQMRPSLPLPARNLNEANFKFSNDYGAGLIDATAAVTRALTWTNLSQEISQTVRYTPPVPSGDIADNGTVLSMPFTFSGQNLRAEQIEVELRIDHPLRGDLRIELISPAGTRSVLAVPRLSQFVFSNNDYADIVLSGGFFDTRSGGWTFSTTHHWGENTQGTWRVEVSDLNPVPTNYAPPGQPPVYGPPTFVPAIGTPNGSKGRVIFGEVRLYGTASGNNRVTIDEQSYTITEPGTPANQDVVVRRLGPTGTSFTVDYQTTQGTATPNLDYTPKSGTLIFGPNDVTQTIPVEVLPDSVPESTETVNVVLTNLNGSNVSYGGITMTTIKIIDDESQLVTVEAVDSRAAETHQGLPKDPGTFVVSRSKVTDQSLAVSLSFSGTATPGNGTGDYQTAPTQVVIPAFQRSVVIPIQPFDDSLFEGTETVIATVLPTADPQNNYYEVGVPGTDTVNIVDNDRPKVQIGILNNDRVATEAATPTDTASLRVSRDLVTDQPLTVFLRFGGTQIVGLNYKLTYVDVNNVTHEITDPLNAAVVIEPNEAYTDVTLVPLNDDIYQVTKSVLLGLQPNDAYDFSFGFLTQISILINEDDPKLDAILPTVSITSPKNNVRVQSPSSGAPADVTITGRANDNQAAGLKRISYRLNGGVWTDVPGFALGNQSFDWTVTFHQADVLFGANTFEVKALDIGLNESRIAVVKFYYAQARALTTSVSGTGTVSAGFQPTSDREAGTKVVVTATPAAGQVFDKWTLTPSGGMPVDYRGRSLTFLMPNVDAALTANFVASPFTADIAGEYNGLVKPAAFTFDGTGFVHLTIGPTGAFTGQLTYAGQLYKLKGEFSGSGRYTTQVDRPKASPLAMDLTIDLAPAGTKRITGTITSPVSVSSVSADRAAYSKTAPAPANLVKSYTLLFPQTLGPGLPQGTGNATMKIDAAGKVSWIGRLPDGTTVKQSIPLSKDGTWPLFLNLYNKRGVMMGMVTHQALAGSDLDGQLDWRRPADQRAKMFQAGFNIPQAQPPVPQLAMVGSEYVPPAVGLPVINLSANIPNANTKLDLGNLLAPIAQQIAIDSANKVTVTGTNANRLSVKINTTTGAFTGTFVHPVSNKRVTLNGIFFQKTNLGYGSFIGSSVPGAALQTGTFTMTPIPPIP